MTMISTPISNPERRFNKVRGGKTKRLMTLAQKLEQDLDEHLVSLALTGVLPRRSIPI